MSLLRKFIRATLNEAPVLAKQAISSGLAMMQEKAGGDGIIVILYNPAVCLKGLMKVSGESSEYDSDEDVDTSIRSAFEESIVGYLKLVDAVDSCNGALEVAFSAATKGYGPLLYDIGMSLAPHGIISDRGSVSKSAQSIWQQYNTRGSGVHGHVYKKPLDDRNDPKTPDPSDDCDVSTSNDALNFSYEAESRIDTSAFTALHAKFVPAVISVLKKHHIKENVVVNRLLDAAAIFFDARYLEGIKASFKSNPELLQPEKEEEPEEKLPAVKNNPFGQPGKKSDTASIKTDNDSP